MNHRGPACRRSALAKLLLSFAAGCGGAGAACPVSPGLGPGPEITTARPIPCAPLAGGLRVRGLGGSSDPTVRGARILPGSLYGSHPWGAEPGGRLRSVVAGVRVITSVDGGMVAASQRLPASPSAVVALPERLGGGFVLAIGARLWRADTWLGPARPIYSPPFPIGGVCVGLDRLYVRSAQGLLAALDPRTGAPLDLGPIPPSPRVAGLVALDAWHEMAILDFRGAMVTADAGSSWRRVSLPVDPTGVRAFNGAFDVDGASNRSAQSWRVSPDGQEVWPIAARAPGPDTERPEIAPAARPFGPRPIIAAIEDGWPLSDGSALVARDGALARVRLSDGVILEMTRGAFPLDPARCHPLSLAREQEPGAFGFACGEERGKTIVYAFSPTQARLLELRRFDDPREILAFGNGALAARGGCDSGASQPGGPAGTEAWCVRTASGAWREVSFHALANDTPRLAVLSDGREALVHPPRGGELSTARLTIVDGARETSVPLRWPALDPQVTHALRWGVWMDGLEERRPGVLSGWVAAGGSLLGLEISLTGDARVGELIRDAGNPIASGRWAFGWTASGAGFETTDGGMTWTKEIDLPVPISDPTHEPRELACGPVGCAIAGWLRVGWGPGPTVPPPAVPPDAQPPPQATPCARGPSPALNLDCEPLAGKPPEDAPAVRRESFPPLRLAGRIGGLSSTSTWDAVSEFPSFARRRGPAIGPGEMGFSSEVSSGLEFDLRLQPLGIIYAWGSASGDWASSGHWQVRWQSPWGGWQDARSSAVTSGPWLTPEAARRAIGQAYSTRWTLTAAATVDQALLIGKRVPTGPMSRDGSETVILLERGRAPIEVKPVSGEPFPHVEAAAQIGDTWVLASTPLPGEGAATVLWTIDGASAHEVGRVPRLSSQARARAPLRLASHASSGRGRKVGLVVEGQPEHERGAAFWVTSFDLATGAAGESESLGSIDLSDRTVLPCEETGSGGGGDDDVWVFDMAYPGDVALRAGRTWQSSLQSPMARLHLGRDGACVESLSGSVDAYSSTPPSELFSNSHPRSARPQASSAPGLEVSVLSARTRFPLLCHESPG